MRGLGKGLFAACFASAASGAFAFGIYGNTGLTGGYRWDAAPQTMGGLERSLNGGLRYSVQGSSYQAYRDTFSWSGGAPSVAAFQTAVQSAFNAWTAFDPASNLATTVSFTQDLATGVDGAVVNGVRQGAEIDLFGANSASTWGNGDGSLRAEAWFNASSVPGGYTLTSGTAGYAPFAISGADIIMNSNPNALWTLGWFQTILTHEIGHALGLADVDFQSGPNGTFIDDNYDGTNNATAAATLTNSFAGLVNIANPAASALNMYFVNNGSPGFDSPGAEILMESSISNFFLANPSLQNDDFAGRQFLYPTNPVPEPMSAAVLAIGTAAMAFRRSRKKSRPLV